MARTGRPKARLEVTAVERGELERLARRARTNRHVALRAKIVLRCAHGESNVAVAAKLRCSNVPVGKWRQRFTTGRVDALYDEPKPGAPRTLSDADVESILERIDPRRLSAGQQQELRDLLSQAPDRGPVTVTSVAGDLEGKVFADQIDAVLKAAAWPTEGVAEGTYPGADPVGLGVVVRDPDAPPGRANTLLNAFGHVEVPIGVAQDPGLDTDAVTILVGVKP